MDRRALTLGSLAAVGLAGCGVTATAGQVGDSEQAATPSTVPDIAPDVALTVPLSLFLIEEAGAGPDSQFSSQRTEGGLAVIAGDMGEVWAQANVIFDPVNIETIQVPCDVLEAIATGLDTGPFFEQVGNTFDIPNAGAVNGFYLRFAGRVNGFAPNNSRVFFVVDEPTVNDERVSSHEVGHIFGLHHQLQDPGTLMFSGTNGTVLNDDEIVVARYTAQGVLDGVR